MRNKQLLIKEIVEANAIKGAYNCYLASGRAINEVENTTQVMQNLNTVSSTLRQLYSEFEDLKKNTSRDEKREITGEELSSCQSTVGRVQLVTSGKGEAAPPYFGEGPALRLNALQTANAIMLFNSDVRFSITE
ncbi:hypothetical protein ACLI09_07590 [Flavobacterium sp. RHBU_24]|uniref:hypothetical protein n=1 Tax=Flavobacterium sp. RHBU_24 TaxID=3391185 RepID=UPI003984A674